MATWAKANHHPLIAAYHALRMARAKSETNIACPGVVERFMRAWAMRKVARLRPHLRGRSVLDVGAGDGWIAERLSRVQGIDVTLLDVVDMNRTDLPLVRYDGGRMPFDDRACDTVLAMTVLHHCDEPEAVLDECVRVFRKRLIVTESVYHTRPGRLMLTQLDRASTVCAAVGG